MNKIVTFARLRAVHAAGMIVLGGSSAHVAFGDPAAPNIAATVVARTNAEQVPGTRPGTVFTTLDQVVSNSLGHVGFRGRIGGPTVTGDTDLGLWADVSGALSLIVRHGDQAPGFPPGVTLTEITNEISDVSGNLRINNLGELSFRAQLDGPLINPTDERTVWFYDSNGLALVAREGANPPGTDPAANFTLFIRNQFADDSGVAFAGEFVDTQQTAFGIFKSSNGLLAPIAIPGSQAPDVPAGVEFTSIPSFRMDESGSIAFAAGLTGPGLNQFNAQGIWSDRSGTLELLLRGGATAPGVQPGFVFSILRQPTVNRSGSFVFFGDIFGPGISSANDQGYWSDRSGTLELIARESTQIPGMDPGVVIEDFAGGFAYGNSGRFVFEAFIEGPGVTSQSDRVFFQDDGSGIEVISRERDVAPGPDNLFFLAYPVKVIDDIERLAFQASLGTPSFNSNGVFVHYPTEFIQQVVKGNQFFDVSGNGSEHLLIEDVELHSIVHLESEGQTNVSQLMATLHFPEFKSAIVKFLITDPVDVSWIAGDGLLAMASNWNSGQIPTAVNRLVFPPHESGPYTVEASSPFTADSMQVRDGADVSIDLSAATLSLGSSTGFRTLEVEGSPGNPTILNIADGDVSCLNSNETARIGAYYDGSLLISGTNGALIGDGDVNAGRFGGNGSIVVQQGAFLSAASMSLGSAFDLGGGDGSLTVNDASSMVSLTSSLSIDSGTASVNNGAQLMSNSVVLGPRSATLELSGSGTMAQANADVVLQQPEIGNVVTLRLLDGASISATNVLVQGGVVEGEGAINASLVVGDGDVAPGTSIGTLSVNGDATLQSESELKIEIQGSTGETDVLSVDGAVMRGGRLELRLLDAPVPGGSTLWFLSASDGLSGTFDEVQLIGLPIGVNAFLMEEPTMMGIAFTSNGDFNGDGSVNGADLAALLAQWGPCDAPPASCAADLNADGQVNGADLATLLANWT